MSRKRKKSKAVPVVLVITLLVAALAAGCFLLKPLVTDPIRKSSAADFAKQQENVTRENQEIMAQYNATILELQNQKTAQVNANPAWPDHKSEGWDIIDLSNYPLENQTASVMSRADLKDTKDSDIGLVGSPTKIAKASDKVRKGAGTQHVAEDGRDGAEYILGKLKEKFII